MALKPTDVQKLLHDLKRMAKGFKILRDEDKQDRRSYICDLLQDELDRLYLDINEMSEKGSG